MTEFNEKPIEGEDGNLFYEAYIARTHKDGANFVREVNILRYAAEHAAAGCGNTRIEMLMSAQQA